MPELYDLTDLQLDVMRVLWQRERAAAADVVDALRPDRILAHTTVATLLARLEKRGVVTHTVKGRVYIYEPTITEHQVRGSMLSRVAAAFRGDVPALINQLLSDQQLNEKEIARVRKLVEEHAREVRETDDAAH